MEENWAIDKLHKVLKERLGDGDDAKVVAEAVRGVIIPKQIAKTAENQARISNDDANLHFALLVFRPRRVRCRLLRVVDENGLQIERKGYSVERHGA